jgi:hypothetical protein
MGHEEEAIREVRRTRRGHVGGRKYKKDDVREGRSTRRKEQEGSRNREREDTRRKKHLTHLPEQTCSEDSRQI